MKMFTAEWDILSKFWLNWFYEQPNLVHYSLKFTEHIENGENEWCKMLVNLPTLGVVMC